MFYRNFIKPLLDFTVALIAMVLLSPLILIVGLILSASNSGSPFFFQPRIGKHKRIFKVIKFKTMNDRKGADGNLLPDDIRLTSVGKFVRKTSMDELPQLINILKGDMSFVGPRPLLIEYLSLYSKEQLRRHDVTPGITGWAQINGRNSIRWGEKFKYDVWYIDHQSFWLDVKILFITVLKVLKSEGISGEGMATVQKFNGDN
ncbi:sugar transferase [soil metagenome]